MRHFITFRGIDNGNDIRLDVSAICNSTDTSVTDARCTKDFRSSSNVASFTIGYTPDKVLDPYDGTVIDRQTLYGNAIQYILTCVETKAEMQVEILDDTRTRTVFVGLIDPTDVSISRNRIPQSIAISCRDYTTDLDKEIGLNIVYNNKSVNEIVNAFLAEVYGNGDHPFIGDGTSHTGTYDAISALPDSKTVEYFVVTDGDSNTFRKVIDTLLFECPGYVLHYDHATNRFEIVKSVPDEVDDSSIRTIAYKTEEGIQARTGVYKYDGILLKWPTVEVEEQSNVYSENIEIRYDGTDTLGKILAYGDYYPADGDITATRQEFRRGDYDYATGVSRLQNKDISLLYATDAQLGIIANPVSMRDRGTVADMDALAALSDPRIGDYAKVTDVDGEGTTEYRAYDGENWIYTRQPSVSDGKGNVYTDKGEVSTYASLPSSHDEGDFYRCLDTGITWCWMDNEWQRKISLFCFPVLHTPSVDMTDGNPAFYPRSMWALGRNRSGGMVNLLALSVTATSVSKVKENKTTHPEILKEPEEYTCAYIYDQDNAESFALWLYNAHRIACTTVTWYEWEDQRVPLSVLGERVRVEFMPGRTAVFCVVQIENEAVTRLKRKYKITALLVSGFQSAFSGKHTASTVSADQTRNVLFTEEYFASSSSSTVVPSAWSSQRVIEQGKYLWTKTISHYSDGSVETTYSTVYNAKDGEDADLNGYTYEVEYGLSDSPTEFHFSNAVYGYNDSNETGVFGYEEGDEYGFEDIAEWSPTFNAWYKGLYVWQRIKTTDANGNTTYGDPTYCEELTRSLEQTCILGIIADPKTHEYNPRRTDYQYIPLNLRSVGYKGVITLSTDYGLLSIYDSVNEQYIDQGTSVTESVNGGTVSIDKYYLKVAYTLNVDVELTASLLQWNSDTEETLTVVAWSASETMTVQLETVPAYGDLPSSLNLTDSQKADIVTGNNLIYGDYILTKYVTLKATGSITASDETGNEYTFADFDDYYTRTGDIFTLAAISSFTENMTYYAFRIYPWKYNGSAWERTDDSAVKVDTLNEIVNLAKTQKQDYPLANVDYHDCLYAYEAFIQNLTVGILNVGDIFANNIQSHDYAEDGDGTPTTGYRLEHNGGQNGSGIIKSHGGMFSDMNVRGNMDLRKPDGNGGYTAGANILHPTLTTVEGVHGDPTGKTLGSASAWCFKELYEGVSQENMVLATTNSTVLGTPVTELVKLTNPSAVMKNDETGTQKTLGNNVKIAVFSPTHAGRVTVTGTRPVRRTGAFDNTWRAAGLTFTDSAGNVLASIAQSSNSGSTNPPFSVSFDIGSGTTIYCQTTDMSGSTTYDGYCTGSVSALTFTMAGLDKLGLWFLTYQGSVHPSAWRWHDIEEPHLSATESYDVTVGGVNYESSLYINLRKMDTFTSYSSYTWTEGGITHTETVEIGNTYRLDSALTTLTYEGIPISVRTASFFRRNSASDATVIFSDGSNVDFASTDYLYMVGRIAIATTEEGVEMKGQYPVADNAYDLGTPSKRWRDGHIDNVISSGVQIGNPDVGYSDNADYQGSIQLANGLILKYGCFGRTATGGSIPGVGAVTYTTPFPNATLLVTADAATPAYTGIDPDSDQGLQKAYNVYAYNVTASSFKVFHGSGTSEGNTNVAKPFYWLALGF